MTKTIAVDESVYEELILEKENLANKYDVSESKVTFAHATRSLVFGIENYVLQKSLEEL